MFSNRKNIFLHLLLSVLLLIGAGTTLLEARPLQGLDPLLKTDDFLAYSLINWSPDSRYLLVSDLHSIKRYDTRTGRMRTLLKDAGAELYAPLLKADKLLVLRKTDWDKTALGVYSLAQRRYQLLLPDIWDYHDCRAAQAIYTINAKGIRSLRMRDLQTAAVLTFRHDYWRSIGHGLECGVRKNHLYFITGKRDIYDYEPGTGAPMYDYYPQIWEKVPGQHSKVLVKFFGQSSDYAFWNMRFSGDRQKLAWVGTVVPSLFAFPVAHKPKVWRALAGTEGNGHKHIVSIIDAPVWLPDNRRIFFKADGFDAGGKEQQLAHVIDIETNQLVAIPGTEAIRQPTLSTDGSTIAYFEQTASKTWEIRWRPLKDWVPN